MRRPRRDSAAACQARRRTEGVPAVAPASVAPAVAPAAQRARARARVEALARRASLQSTDTAAQAGPLSRQRLTLLRITPSRVRRGPWSIPAARRSHSRGAARAMSAVRAPPTCSR